MIIQQNSVIIAWKTVNSALILRILFLYLIIFSKLLYIMQHGIFL